MNNLSPSFVLDISRLLSRAGRSIPTGIDRVELAYAEHLLAYHEKQTYFVALSPAGWISQLPHRTVSEFITALIHGWNLGEKKYIVEAGKISNILKAYTFLARSLPPFNKPAFYLLISHHHLMKQKTISNFLLKTKCYFVPMVHDLIPMEYPEYARPREKLRHLKRMITVVKLAHAVIVPTNYVKKLLDSLFLQENRQNIPVWTVPHGVYKQHITYNRFQNKPIYDKKKPYFVYLSTIEPRKNHLLLLNLWRQMIQTRGKENVPRLILIGKRGWENENILDLLERSPLLEGVVMEESHLSDEEVIHLLRNANGLLFPSFTEGFGLPLTEAMSLSVPSICSDIPSLREVGENIPIYLSPLDATDWAKVIDDFSAHGPLWQAQKKRLHKWSPISWSQSVAKTLSHCTTLVQNA